MISRSKTSLDLNELLSSTIIKITLRRKFIKKIKIVPFVEEFFGKTYFSVQVVFDIDSSLRESMVNSDFEEMQDFLLRNSLSRTHLQSIYSESTNYLHIMMEINENESKYNLFTSTLTSFIDQSGFLQSSDQIGHDGFCLLTELDSFKAYPLLKFRRQVLDNFFMEKDAILDLKNLSYNAYHRREELLEIQKKKEEQEISNHIATRKLIAEVGDYCIVVNEYDQPLNVMEVTDIGKTKTDTYRGFEVKTDLKTGKRMINTVNERIAAVFPKKFFQNLSIFLGKTRSKQAVIEHVAKLPNQTIIKYYDKTLFKRPTSAGRKIKWDN